MCAECAECAECVEKQMRLLRDAVLRHAVLRDDEQQTLDFGKGFVRGFTSRESWSVEKQKHNHHHNKAPHVSDERDKRHCLSKTSLPSSDTQCSDSLSGRGWNCHVWDRDLCENGEKGRDALREEGKC